MWGRFGSFRRAGVHAHRLEKVQVNEVEVEVAGRLLFLRVEGGVPVEVLEGLNGGLSCGVLEGGQLKRF
jgi:hypothetical protein